MNPVDVHLSKIEDCLSKMDDMLTSKRSLLFTNNISVDKDALFEIIDEIRPILDEIKGDLPGEITQAKWFISNNDKMTTDARNKAQSVIKSAEAEAAKMVDEHEITRQAQEQAAQILENAKRDARDMRLNAREYADELLEKTDEYVRRAMEDFNRGAQEVDAFFRDTLETVYGNRQELRDRQ